MVGVILGYNDISRLDRGSKVCVNNLSVTDDVEFEPVLSSLAAGPGSNTKVLLRSVLRGRCLIS